LSRSNYACDVNGVCYIEGWNEAYLIDQGNTNTCAIASYRMGASVILGEKIPEDAVKNIWFYRNGGRDWGVPPFLQGSPNSVVRNVKATPTKGNKADIINYVVNDIPVIVTFAYPLWGHAVLAIGYNERSNELLFADSAVGRVVREISLLARMEEQIAYSYPDIYQRTISSNPNAYTCLDGFLSHRDFMGFVPPYSITTMTKSRFGHYGGPPPPQMPTHPGGVGINNRFLQ